MESVKKRKGFFKSFDGEEIYREIRGEGPPVFFCYGIGCLFNHWSPQIRYFSRSRTTLMMDYRGHHKTGIPDDKETLTINALAHDLILACETMGYAEADFVGHSFGCQVILEAWRLKPSLFKSMVFINGVSKNPFDQLIDAKSLVERVNQVKVLYNQAPQFFSALWKKGVTNPLLVPLSSISGGFNLSKTAFKDIEIYARGVSSIDLRVFMTFFEQMVEFNAEEWMSRVTIPVLIICGSKDALTPIESQTRMHELFANSELYPVPYGSHCTQLDFPEMVNLRIENFFNECERDLKNKRQHHLKHQKSTKETF